jgi:hypothetical protein
MMPYRIAEFRHAAMPYFTTVPLFAPARIRTSWVRRCGFRTLVGCIVVLAVSACQTPVPQSPDTVSAPVERDRQWRQPDQTRRFVVDANSSELRLLVYRAGSLAGLGHNHVIVGHAEGEIYIGSTAATSGFRLCVPVASMEVDDQSSRVEEGVEFEQPVPEAARAATRSNMLSERVLNAGVYPLIEIVSERLSGPLWNPEVTAVVDLGGSSRELVFPAAVVLDQDRLVIIARFSFLQSDFAMEPYSVLGGNLRVQDRVEARVRLVARRPEAPQDGLAPAPACSSPGLPLAESALTND